MIRDARGAQRGAKILLMAVKQLTHRALHVDLVDQVHAAAEVETKVDVARNGLLQAALGHPDNAKDRYQQNGNDEDDSVTKTLTHDL